MAPGRRFVSFKNERYDRYYRMLGELQFSRYDPVKLTAGLGPEAEQAVAKKIGELSSRGFLNPLHQSSVHVLSPDGVFWGNNIAADPDAAQPILSPEYILAQNPDFLFGAMAITKPGDILAADSVITKTRAGMEKNISIVPSSLLIRTSPRIVDSLLELYGEIQGYSR
jgi:hypothetical protein